MSPFSVTETGVESAERLNRECACIVTDVPRVHETLRAGLDAHGITEPLTHSHPHLFSELPVFLAPEHARAMRGIITAIEATIALPAWRDAVLAHAPPIARASQAPLGVFMGYDFHVGPEGPKLIEINTNAGGALLNGLALAGRANCCPGTLTPDGDVAALEHEIVAMFEREWRLARGDAPLRTIAIVDDEPAAQYLYPEFLLFRRLFAAHGYDAIVADARALEMRDGALNFDGKRIDLVYNRVTDFYFAQPQHQALSEAYRSGAAVLTPHPHAHALYADKRNLIALSDAATLRALGSTDGHIATLTQGIARTVAVEGDDESWWRDRKRWFFKPTAGFGGRGAYRGDKLTRRVFTDIMAGGYVAQSLTPPGQRRGFKVDVRNYTYDGHVQLIAARLYQGQTTNFRTTGGGFAAIHAAPAARVPPAGG